MREENINITKKSEQLNFFEEEVIQVKEGKQVVVRKDEYVDLKDIYKESNFYEPYYRYRIYQTGGFHFWQRKDQYGLFQGNDFPFLKNMDTGKIIQMSVFSSYPAFAYRTTQKEEELSVINLRAHIMLAKIWIPNPENKDVVNHINFNTFDFRVSNLEWNTRKENAIGPKKEISKSLEDKYDHYIDTILYKMQHEIKNEK